MPPKQGQKNPHLDESPRKSAGIEKQLYYLPFLILKKIDWVHILFYMCWNKKVEIIWFKYLFISDGGEKGDEDWCKYPIPVITLTLWISQRHIQVIFPHKSHKESEAYF